MMAQTLSGEFHLTLRAQVEMLSCIASNKARSFFNENLTKAQYINYLQDIYHSVRASCPVMEMAITQFKKAGKKESLPLIEYLEHHLIEERQHDEWILEDLEHLGVDSNIAVQQMPRNDIVNLIGGVYYRVLHLDPVAIFGFLAALETGPLSSHTLDVIMKAAGLDKKSTRTLRHHSILDIDHSQEIYQTLSNVDLSERQKNIILDCSKATILQLPDFA